MPIALVARVFDTQANQSFEATFERFPVRIGRNQLNDMPIDRPYVSQFHAAIEVHHESQLFVKDLGSTNGTLYKGQRLARDQMIDITAAPEVTIGPVVIRLGLVTQQQQQPRPEDVKDGGILDFGHGPETVRALAQRFGPVPPGAEDPYIRQVAPYIEAYRQAWQTVYRVVYDHLTRLPPDVRTSYLRRLGYENPSVSLEGDFRKIAQYYGVDLRAFTQAGPGQAEPVNAARDAKELGNVLLGHTASDETARSLQNTFVEVMSHQVGLMNGVMEGVKQLLEKLSPKAIESEFERMGKKGGLFSSRFEELWKLYEVRHADYAGEDKETFLVIFGSQFSRAYAAAAGENYKGEPNKNLGRFTIGGSRNRDGT